MDQKEFSFKESSEVVCVVTSLISLQILFSTCVLCQNGHNSPSCVHRLIRQSNYHALNKQNSICRASLKILGHTEDVTHSITHGN